MKASLLIRLIRNIKDARMKLLLHRRFSMQTLPIEVEKKIPVPGEFRRGRY
jgi:hypothetical protein